ncbi:cyclodeaminase/cyclohydrolase family protein [[Collinsella] massiliensis]|uniref:Sugar ABC transporter substrate-binding protein n=1 Tax=[Collinsella] massiliensis TaxID=1232426 RepID=A0A1Y3Y4K3_9ACTN|nr:cyclodeaminase/cyclohydrolase family protein [[Collinsella] massiliensis]OUN89240.1 sugar ABC transporter substrate-binding protein [[Collinsella] massiliensis]
MTGTHTAEGSIADLSCRAFAADLAAKLPVPGGGGASALVGALGAALCSMAGNFTAGKKRFAAVEDDVQRILAEAEVLRHKLIGLIEADAAAFEPVSRAYRMPKEDPARAQVLEVATKTACSAPIETMRVCARVIELLEEMGGICSPMLLSDVGCGAVLGAAALRAASVNVFVNTSELADRAYAEALEREADGLLEAYIPRAEALAARVTDHIRGRG